MFPNWRLLIAFALVGCAACHHRQVGPDGQPLVSLPPGAVLLLPPRNVIQDGRPHRVGRDSGTYFAKSLQGEFEKRGWHVVTPTDTRFMNTEIPSAGEALAEARHLNADYVFRTVLGEFRDAAPMTFRPDFVMLDDAHLWQVKTGALVWSLPKQLESNGNNLRHYYRLLDELAELAVIMISKAEVPVDALAGPLRPVVDPLGTAARSSAQCTTDQILSMKNSGMNDDQVRRACGEQ